MIEKVHGEIKSGGRKTAYASVLLTQGSGTGITVNTKPAAVYFQENSVFLQNLLHVYDMVKAETKYDAIITVHGGGLSAQAQACRLALCKAFSTLVPHLRPYFKKRGFLTRDARIKERRKYGLKKARKAPQFSKR
uniref:Small ribosomal subunit protein uS9c n=1 Tax=Pseudochloris wilhelmii TaxID=1418016 RepID=A0A097KQT7_9CHLO|nr:ribosomal protein S9 [Pseudochloris wilhelmii]AIT95542.1 ribosomal protein S9 [Pseudochloris wilhelmii]